MVDSPVPTDKRPTRPARTKNLKSKTIHRKNGDSPTPPGESPTPTPNPAALEESQPDSTVRAETIGVKEVKSDKVNPLLIEDKTQEFTLDISSSSIVLMALLDGLAGLLFGPDARMNDTERALINEPLERILKRLSPEVVKAVSQWGDYVMLAMGLIAWGSRITRLQKETAEKTQKEKAPTRPPAPPPDEGPPAPENVNRLDLGDLTAAPVTIAAQLGEI